MALTFEGTYGDTPWAGIGNKTRDVFIPDLIDVYRRTSFFQPFVPFRVDLGSQNAESMSFTTMYELLDDRRQLGLTQLWMDPFHTDSERKSISLARYGGKVALHDYDEMVNQWKGPGGLSALRGINRNKLATQMTRTLDLLARDAFLSGTWHMFGADGSKANFGSLVDTAGADNFDPNVARDIWLGMQNRMTHGAIDAASQTTGDMMVAMTSPGVVHSIRGNAGWIDAINYANPAMRVRNEVGTYLGVRYLQSPDMILWNCGALDLQATIAEPLYPDSGAARNADANRVIGQDVLAAGHNRYIQLGTTNLATTKTFVTTVTNGATQELLSTSVKPNDRITIHILRTGSNGVTDGVDYLDGSIVNATVVSVDNATRRITLNQPIGRDFSTDLGSGVYAYISIGTNVHGTAFLTGSNSVVSGVARPPMFHAPDPVDDFGAYHRFTWDMYGKFQIWSDSAVEVLFNTGPYRLKGNTRY
jgi:N4-gp56 family major capsid protein